MHALSQKNANVCPAVATAVEQLALARLLEQPVSVTDGRLSVAVLYITLLFVTMEFRWLKSDEDFVSKFFIAR